MTEINVESVKKEVTKDGYYTVTKIVQNFKHLSPRTKIFFGVYAGLVFAHNTFTNYNIGKIALLDYRNDNGRTKSEFETVKDAVCEGSFSRLLSSFVFPYTLVSDVMPGVVLYLNPKQNNETESKTE